MEAAGWLFKMMSLLGACAFKLHGIFTRFLCATCLQKKYYFYLNFITKYDVMMTSPLDYDKIK